MIIQIGLNLASADGSGQRMIGTSYEQHAGQAADGTGKQHGADDYALDLDAYIAGGALAFADNTYLITMFRVIQVDIHQYT